MPIFEYKGLDKSGRSVRGTLDAESQRSLRQRLKKDGIFVTSITDKTKARAKSRSSSTVTGSVSVEDLASMTRQLATLLKAGIPLVESLVATADQVEHPVLKEALSDIKNQVNEGSTLNKALSKYPRIFTNIFITMCEAGEATGTLDLILLRLAEFTEAQNALNSKIKSAVLYPVVMTIFMMIMLGVMFVFVVPKMTSIFESQEMQLPWYTQVTIGLSGFMVESWYLIAIGVVAIFLTFRAWKASPSGAEQYDRMILVLPIVGKLARMVAVSRFTRTLATLLNGGVPMLQALDIVRNVVGNSQLAHAIEEARNNIREGESIAAPLKRSGQFPPIVIHMVTIGEKTGELEGMLTQVAESFDFQVDTQVQGLTALLGPLLIVLMGALVGGVVFSVMVPIFEMTNLGGGAG